MEKVNQIKSMPKSAKVPQKIIKSKTSTEKSTRFQDNYFNPKLHKHNWEPSGKIKEKNKYTYGDTGLGFDMGDQNILKKDKNSIVNKTTPTHFLEFDFLENNDIIVIIEHCSNCEEHLNHTNHVNNIYKNISKLLQLCINLRFPFIKVYSKPIDINNKNTSKLGAFEVQLGMKINDNKSIVTLFSKLKSNQWPSFNNILNKINNIVPLLDIKCTVYDKEEDMDITDNSLENTNTGIMDDKNDNELRNKNILLALPSKYENIKINLYSLKNKQIELYCKEASNQLNIAFNPKKRAEIFAEEQNLKNNDNNNTNINGDISKISNKLNLTQKNFGIKSDTSLQNFQSNNSINKTFNYSMRSNLNSIFSNISKKGELIEDLSMVNDMKGKLLSTGYVDKSGVLIFENVPYDSYLIEVESSKIFLGCGMPLLFQKIFNKNSTQKQGNYLLNKIFGLKRQIDAFVEVYLFSKEKEKNDEFTGINLISDAKVVLVKKYFDSGDKVAGNVDEFELEENKNIKGRYEIVTEAGDAELNVSKKGYENIYKKIRLKNGINKINIELVG